MNTAKVRERITKSGLYMWQVAKAAGISSSQLSVWLRDDPMPEERQKRIVDAILNLEKGETT